MVLVPVALQHVHRIGRTAFSAASRLLSLLALVITSCAVVTAAEAVALEYQVKAAFLLNFTKFIEWPAGQPENTAFKICILGDDSFGGLLDRMVEGETVGSHKIEVQRSRFDPPVSCQVVFVSPNYDGNLSRTLTGLGPGVLTVGEGDRFVREGGMIAFVIENRHVRFDVNQTAALNAKLRFSSKLLNVARMVKK